MGGVGVEAVNGVIGSRRHVGAIKSLDGDDVIEQRRAGIELSVIGAGASGGPIAHQRKLPAVLDIGGIVFVGDGAAAGVVIARMLQAERVTDLMQQCHETISFRRGGSLVVITVDPDIARGGG